MCALESVPECGSGLLASDTREDSNQLVSNCEAPSSGFGLLQKCETRIGWVSVGGGACRSVASDCFARVWPRTAL